MDKNLASMIFALGVLMVFFILYEKSKITSKEISIIVVLSAVAGVGRIPFAALPNVQPTTFIVIIAGFVFGPLAGFAVGIFAALISNIFLGQGPWTIWQMLAWGICGMSCGMFSKLHKGAGMKSLIVFSFIWGFLFGWIMNLWYWVSFVYPLTFRSWLGTNLASVWFDGMHAVGNVVFMAVFGGSFVKILKHFKRKLSVTYINA